MDPQYNGLIFPLCVVEDLEPLRTFYTEKLGFEESTYLETGAPGEAMAIFSYITCRMGFATPNAVADLPAGPTRNAMVCLEIPDAQATHTAMSHRAADVLGEVKKAPWGHYFDVTDPAGTVVRFLEIPEN